MGRNAYCLREHREAPLIETLQTSFAQAGHLRRLACGKTAYLQVPSRPCRRKDQIVGPRDMAVSPDSVRCCADSYSSRITCSYHLVYITSPFVTTKRRGCRAAASTPKIVRNLQRHKCRESTQRERFSFTLHAKLLQPSCQWTKPASPPAISR